MLCAISVTFLTKILAANSLKPTGREIYYCIIQVISQETGLISLKSDINLYKQIS